MKQAVPFIAGLLMSPVSVLGLFWQQSFIWVVCPQALVVLFLRQSQGSYDSLGAAGYPDLAVGALYHPVLGWILSRAIEKGTLRRTALRVAFWHGVALVLAWAMGEFRNGIWGVGFGR